jgi:hypothetical protein
MKPLVEADTAQRAPAVTEDCEAQVVATAAVQLVFTITLPVGTVAAHEHAAEAALADVVNSAVQHARVPLHQTQRALGRHGEIDVQQRDVGGNEVFGVGRDHDVEPQRFPVGNHLLGQIGPLAKAVGLVRPQERESGLT